MANVVMAQKNDVFRVRINAEIKQHLEEIYAKTGLTLTDAVNVFFQQSLNVGGFPFAVNAENAEQVKAKALSRLVKELEVGQQDKRVHSEAEVYELLGVK